MVTGWAHSLATGGQLVAIKDDVVALARLVRYSEEEARRLGVPSVVVECLSMAGIELINTIEHGNPDAAEEVEPRRVARMN
jgi:hypothetical protein